MKHQFRLYLLLLALALVAVVARAQDYRFEVGPRLGMSGYLGDVSQSNVWQHPGLVGGGSLRYIFNSRLAVKANLDYAHISGNSDDLDNKYPGEPRYEFGSSLFDLGVQGEFNFFSFGSGPRYKQYKRISPYITVGLGAVLASSGGNTAVSMTVPLGVGVKYKFKDRLNFSLEFTMRKEFSDKIDNLSDLYGIKHSFAKNTDWYSFTVFSVTYEFSKRCVKCHYVD